MSAPVTAGAAYTDRRRALMERFDRPALLSAGSAVSRNFPANRYRFRATSHFLYFMGQSMPEAALLLCEGRSTLFTHPPDPADALWHGPRPALSELGERWGLDAVLPLTELDQVLAKIEAPVATLPTQDATSAAWLSERLGRSIKARTGAELVEGSPDAALADAVIALRLIHDEAAIAQLRAAAEGTAAAQADGMRASRVDGTEAEVLAAIVGSLRRQGLDDSFQPIVTVRGEVLHNEDHGGRTQAGDLLLADVGGETAEGWAADITRTYPVNGRFSATQRAVYEVVLSAELEAIAAAQVGAGYRAVHEAAKRATVRGLRDLGIFRGEVDGLLERGAAAIFFPHGVGHLLGLDAHDMEDLGDRAGYATGRSRSDSFGDAYLRLDRDLEPGMLVTAEPGFYQVPGILADETYTGAVGADLDRDILAKFADVQGIRIEDDVLITESGPDVLTKTAPKTVDEIEQHMAAR